MAKIMLKTLNQLKDEIHFSYFFLYTKKATCFTTYDFVNKY